MGGKKIGRSHTLKLFILTTEGGIICEKFQIILPQFELCKFIASEGKAEIDVSVMWGWPTYMQDLSPPEKTS